MESIWLQLKTIIWKNFITRKNHFILNVFEILTPVVMYYLIATFVSYKDTIFNYAYISTPTYVKERSSEEIYELFRRDTIICFTPNNHFTVLLLDKVMLKLNNTNMVPVSTELDLMAYYKQFEHSNSSVTGVVFKKLDNNTVPQYLDYVIMPGEHYLNWHLSQLVSDQQKPYEPNSGSKIYFEQGFIALQMALDISYIEIVSSKDLPYAIRMQEFPYPPHSRDSIESFVYSLYAFCTVLSFMLLCPALIAPIVEERGTGLKDLMKTTGLQSWIFWLGWFLYAFPMNFLAVSIISILITTERWTTEFPEFEHCDWSLFFVFLLLYCAAGIMFCFAISVFFYNPNAAVLTGTIMWLLSFIVPLSATSYPDMAWSSKLLLMLMPNRALLSGFLIIEQYEQRDINLDWSYLFKSAGYNDVTMGHVLNMLLLDIIIYLLLTTYVDNVMPGPHDVGKPYHFPVSYIWNRLKKTNRVQNIEESVIGCYGKTEPVQNLNTVIHIQHLYRKYDKVIAINDLSMDIYEGEVTVLLGHNEAGKTTILSIITGMFGVSSGKVSINNFDIKHDFNIVRDLIGFSPQQNWYFSNFTVLDHLKFFGMLKGLSLKQAKEDGYNMLRYMKMHTKCNAKVSQLSTILQRKLSLAIALTGYPKILILDEPTIGLDPEGRREIWDLLISMKDFYTIIIATNLMEEAHLLGDRIAIIDHGRLMCYGTPIFLKKEYGAGYHLQLTRDPNNSTSAQFESISKIVHKTVPTANMQYCSDNHIVYLLPYEKKPQFCNLLDFLESKKMILGIKNISMSVTTLQEFFLSIGDTTDKRDFKAYSASSASDSVSGAVSSIFTFVTDTTPKCRGVKLFMLQLWSLFKKRWYFARRNSLSILILVLLMLFLGFAVLYYTKPSNSPYSVNKNRFNFDLCKYGETKVVYATNTSKYNQDEDLRKIMQEYNNLVSSEGSKIKKVPSVPQEILTEELRNIIRYSLAMVIGAEFNTSNKTKIINAMYSNNAFHAAPISLNLIMKSLLRSIMGDKYSISTSILPFINVKLKLQDDENVEWTIIFPLGILLFLSVFTFFPCMEQVFKVKQLQLSCGVHPALYWLICYIFDIILYMIGIILLMLLMHGYYAATSTVHFGEKHYCALLVIFSAFGLSVLPFIYILSYNKTTRGAYVIFLISGLLSTIAVLCIEIICAKLYSQGNIHLKRANYVFCIFPPFGLSYTLAQFSKMTMVNYYFDISSSEDKNYICRHISHISPCCDDEKSAICIDHRSYFGKHDNSIFFHVIIMLCSSVIYFIILLLLETHFVHKYYEIFKLWYSTRSQVTTDKKADRRPNEDISREMKIISDILKKEKQVSNYISEGDLLVVHKPEKLYGTQRVVRGFSFRVQYGDCFGILAVKGSAKTPILRILTGYLPLISGEARIFTRARKKVYLSEERKSFLKNLGYCPEFDCFNEALTGRQMLQLFAELRGVWKRVHHEVNKYITAFGLDECADTPCGHYSSTNKRKLNVAIALIGEPLLVMLDEPTKGMDPISRRQLWDILVSYQNQEAQSTVILALHNMEECTALCNRLAILKAGRVEYYGNINDLKNKYGRGFTVFLKVKPNLHIINRSSISSTSGLFGSFPRISNSRSQSLSRDRSGSVKVSGQLKPRISSNDPAAVVSLMLAFENKYGEFCTLVDKHVGLIHYHINKTTKWSLMFSEMEALKLQHPIIEDYSISETTLEEVFLSMVRTEEHEQTKYEY